MIQPLAAESAVVLEWAKVNLTAPSCIYVQALPQERVNLDHVDEGIILTVPRIRRILRREVEASCEEEQMAVAHRRDGLGPRLRKPGDDMVAPPLGRWAVGRSCSTWRC